MRMLPVCLYGYEMQKRGKYGTDDVIRMIHQASELTHAHMRSKIACGLYYFLVEAILDNRGNLYECIRYGLKQGMEYYGLEPELRFYERLKDKEAEKLCSEVKPYNKEAASITFDIIKAYFKKMGYGENLWGFNR